LREDKQKQIEEGRALKQARRIANLKQENVARLLEISQTTVSEWERGVTRIPNLETVLKAIRK